MAGVQRSGARWIALLLGGALVASAIVVYALIRVTTPSGSGTQTLSSTPTTVVPSSAPTTTSASVGGSSSTTSSAATTGLASASSDAPSTTPEPLPDSTPASADSSSAESSPSASGAVTTASSTLSGSGVVVPAAWSGTAKITVTVLGQCANGSTSVYPNTPADVALDLTQNEASAVATTATSALLGNEPALTLGVNAAEVPSLAVYSSAVDDAGVFHRYWRLQLTAGTGRTNISGTMIDQSVNGANPNIMVDAETSLQPCETAGTVGLPRVLGPGSSISGWVSQTNASLTLHATTTDGKREVTVEITATRKQ